MKSIYLPILFTVICASFLGSVNAVDSAAEHAPVLARQASAEERYEIYQAQEKVAPEAGAVKLQGKMSKNARFAAFGRGLSDHLAAKFDPYGSYVVLDDGTNFSVKPSDRWKVQRWAYDSPVYVLPNHGYFFGMVSSGYDLCLYNPYTGDTVEVYMTAGPYYFGVNSKWIYDIDHYAGVIWLNNGLAMYVHPNDIGYTWSWDINDHLIIGDNDDGYQYTDPYIIFNVATATYVRASFY